MYVWEIEGYFAASCILCAPSPDLSLAAAGHLVCSKSLIINEKRMINDQKVNTYSIRIIDFLDLLNIIRHHVTGCVRQVSTRHQSLSHLSCSLSRHEAEHKVTNDRASSE